MPLGGRLQLARDFGVTQQMVRNALNWLSNSPLAEQIRTAALERGGELYEKKTAERLIAEYKQPKQTY